MKILEQQCMSLLTLGIETVMAPQIIMYLETPQSKSIRLITIAQMAIAAIQRQH